MIISDIFFYFILICVQNEDFGSMLELPHRDDSNEYQYSMLLSKRKVIIIYTCTPVDPNITI